MKNIKLKTCIWLLVGISFIFFIVIAYFKDITDYTILNTVKFLPLVVFLDALSVGVFSKYLWKYKVFKNWLVPFPNLNGTWKGTIHTTWIDPETKHRPDPIPAIITINHSFSNISCVMRTAEMSSYSFQSSFLIDKENQVKKLLYSYSSKPIPTVKDRSPQHDGSVEFDIIEVPVLKLVGDYSTTRKTTGHIKMEYWKKDKLEEYPDELGKHPVSEARGNNS